MHLSLLFYMLSLKFIHSSTFSNNKITWGNASIFVQQNPNDKKIVTQAVIQNGRALQYASEELKGDKDFVIQAVSQNGEALEYASEELKGDKDFIIQAVSQNGESLFMHLKI